MAIKKVRIRPEGENNYADIVHPETSADIVVDTPTKVVMTKEERDKLSGIQAGAQVNIEYDDTVNAFLAGWEEGEYDDTIHIPYATDADFSGTADGSFRYIGTATTVKIPPVIKGVPVTSYSNMFKSDKGKLVEGVISNNTNVTNMSSMFYHSEATTLDLSSFDTSSVTNMDFMFYGSLATSLDLRSFNTSNVTSMSSMFRDSKATTLDLSSFDTSSVTDMGYMFSGSSATTLDLSSFDTSNVTSMSIMFQNSLATTGYARTQADADKLNTSDDKPAGLTFVVKP